MLIVGYEAVSSVWSYLHFSRETSYGDVYMNVKMLGNKDFYKARHRSKKHNEGETQDNLHTRGDFPSRVGIQERSSKYFEYILL